MQFARRLWIAAVGLLVSAVAVQAQPTKLLPADTEMIVTINLQQMLKSEVAKANKTIIDLAKGKIEEGLEDKGVGKWLKKADFDLFRDLNSVTFAIPGGDKRNPQEDGFIILEGKFDADKIEAAVMEASKEAGGGVKQVKIGGIKAYEVTPKDEKTIYVGVLDKKTMIACGNKKDFEDAVARNEGNSPANFKAAVIKNLMSTVNAKQSINMVATSKILAKMAENAPQGGGAQAQQAIDFLKTMEGFSAALTIQKNIDFQLGVNAQDADTAKKYADASNLGMAFAKMKIAEAAKQNEKLAPAVDVVNSIKISAMGSNLVIRGQVTFENLEKILQNLPIPNN